MDWKHVPSEQVWARDIKMNKHVLPVYADLLFRLQHNALYLGFRFNHIPNAESTCAHECQALETAPHLFWYCTFAAEIWNDWLPSFQRFITTRIEWSTVLYFVNIQVDKEATLKFGYSFYAVFHIVRVVILRSLWMHRNDIRFHDQQANAIAVKAQVRAVINLHIAHLWQDTLMKSLRHSTAVQKQLQALLEALPVRNSLGESVSTSNDAFQGCPQNHILIWMRFAYLRRCAPGNT